MSGIIRFARHHRRHNHDRSHMESTNLDLFTLGAAFLGALTGGAALVWNVLQFRLTGARIDVELRQAAALDQGMGSVVYGTDVWKLRGSYQHSLRLASIKVRNVGRTATTVDSCGVALSKDSSIESAHPRGDHPLPHRL